MRLVVLLTSVVVLAGCTQGVQAPPADPAKVVSDALALLEGALVNDHDHTDPFEHPEVRWRLDQVFETNLPTDGIGALSPPSEFIIWKNYALISVFHPSAGMVIMDLSVPDRPVQVSRFDSGTAYVNDVEITTDGRWAFLPTSPIETRENDPADGGLIAAGDYGIQVVDLANIKQPKLATVWFATDPDHNGYHRVDLEVINGQLYVFGASLGYPRVDILRFDPAPVPRLSLVGVYLSDDAKDPSKDRSSSPTGYGVHDVTVDPDPLTGSPLMAVSHWRSGAHYVDVRDPANPKFLGRWNAFPVQMGNVHNVEFTKIEGKRISVAVAEYPLDPEKNTQGGVWIIDLSDFANPKLIGNWNLPGEHPSGGAPPAAGNRVFSTNRVLIRNGTLFDAHFHAGMIVLGIETLAKAADPELLGFIVPKGETRVPYATIEANPFIYDAIPRGEYVYYTDLTGGFHAAKMDPAVLRGNVFAG
jgi:hypothetical protein